MLGYARACEGMLGPPYFTAQPPCSNHWSRRQADTVEPLPKSRTSTAHCCGRLLYLLSYCCRARPSYFTVTRRCSQTLANQIIPDPTRLTITLSLLETSKQRASKKFPHPTCVRIDVRWTQWSFLQRQGHVLDTKIQNITKPYKDSTLAITNNHVQRRTAPHPAWFKAEDGASGIATCSRGHVLDRLLMVIACHCAHFDTPDLNHAQSASISKRVRFFGHRSSLR